MTPRSKLPPYLVTRLGKKECSLCRKVFPKDSKPSISKAFAEHIRLEHKIKEGDEPKARADPDQDEGSDFSIQLRDPLLFDSIPCEPLP